MIKLTRVNRSDNKHEKSEFTLHAVIMFLWQNALMRIDSVILVVYASS